MSAYEKLPEGKGFLVEKTESFGQSGIRLALTKKSEGNLELFTTMVCDLVETLDEAASRNRSELELLQMLIKRILNWQQFMSRNNNPLSPEAELGLAGELYFLKTLLISSMPPALALKAWVGPDDAPQDFLIGIGAVEVKATLSSSSFPVKIGSLEQLDDATVSPIFLAAIKFSLSKGGMTLPEMVAEIEGILIEEPDMTSLLNEKLLSAGYITSHAENYSRRFKSKEQRILIVENHFPRLTIGSVPIGVIKASYEINLDYVKDFYVELDIMLENLGVKG